MQRKSIQMNIVSNESLKNSRRNTTMLNWNFLNQLIPSAFGGTQKSELINSDNKQRSSLNSKKETKNNDRNNVENENLYMMSDKLGENKYNGNNRSEKKTKSKIKYFVTKILNDEDFVHKNYPNYRLEKILKPGDSYGEAGIEFKTRKFVFYSL